MLGILDNFVGFLIYLGIAIPPVAGIMVVDYYLLKRDRRELDTTRAAGDFQLCVRQLIPLRWLFGLLLLLSVG